MTTLTGAIITPVSSMWKLQPCSSPQDHLDSERHGAEESWAPPTPTRSVSTLCQPIANVECLPLSSPQLISLSLGLAGGDEVKDNCGTWGRPGETSETMASLEGEGKIMNVLFTHSLIHSFVHSSSGIYLVATLYNIPEN